MQERRRFVRMPSRLGATYTVLPDGRAQDAMTADLSGGGIGLITTDGLPRGAVLQVALRLPSGEHPVPFVGEVIWSELREVVETAHRQRFAVSGVRLAEIAPRDQEAIAQFVGSSLRSVAG